MLLSDQTGDNGGSTYRLQYYIGEMPQLINELMSVPDIPIWIHETALCKMLSMPSGEVYGQNSALTCIISTIKKGKGGNAREGTRIAVDSCDCSIAGNRNRVSFQETGAPEAFHAGTLHHSSTQQIPRWFRFGHTTILKLVDQKILVAEAIGDKSVGLEDDVTIRRRDNYSKFFVQESDDGGYLRFDVPMLALRLYQMGD